MHDTHTLDSTGHALLFCHISTSRCLCHRRVMIQNQSSLVQVGPTLGMHNSQTLAVVSASSHLVAATLISRVLSGMMPTGALPIDTPNPTPLNGSPR